MWRERVIAALDRLDGEFTESDRNDAASWTTCAVGEQHQALPEVVLYQTYNIGVTPAGPLDIRLIKLGNYFSDAVGVDDAPWAESLLNEIEDRVMFLKRKLHV